MNINEKLLEIVELEWDMFETVNGDAKVSCQENRPMFEAMRLTQFKEWSEAAADSYLCDLKAAQEEGENLVREKYIWMMKNTAPEDFEQLKDQLPEIDPEKQAVVDEIWAHYLAQTIRMREKYPLVSSNARPLRKEEENADTSVETYFIGELLTYSLKTLKLLLMHIISLEENGVDMAYQIQENSVVALGFTSMDEAESHLAKRILDDMGGECTMCKG